MNCALRAAMEVVSSQLYSDLKNNTVGIVQYIIHVFFVKKRCIVSCVLIKIPFTNGVQKCLSFMIITNPIQIFMALNLHLMDCLSDVSRWMAANKLQLNPDKSEFVVFGSKYQGSKLEQFFSSQHSRYSCDSEFTFSRHVQAICKSCFIHVGTFADLGIISHQMPLLWPPIPQFGSLLGYCISLFRGLSAFNIRKLQCVKNSLAKIVLYSPKFSDITPVCKKLHWLLLVMFKTTLLVYKFLHTGTPGYFAPFLKARSSAYKQHYF